MLGTSSPRARASLAHRTATIEVVDSQGAVLGSPVGDRGGVLGVGLLVVVEVGHVAGEQAGPVQEVDPSRGLLRAEPVLGPGLEDRREVAEGRMAEEGREPIAQEA